MELSEYRPPRRQPIVAAFGEWGQTNIGDHAIHEGVREFFADNGWRTRSYECGALVTARDIAAPELARAHARYRQTGRTSLHLHRWPAAAKRALRSMRQKLLIKRLLPELARTDLICVGGGALLTDDNLHFPQSLAAIAWAARDLGKPLVCLGCSADGPWSPRGREMLGDFLRTCRHVAVRDRVTAQRVQELLGKPVQVFGDFALPLKPVAVRNQLRRYRLAVNVMHYSASAGAVQAQYDAALLRILDMARPAMGGDLCIFTTGTSQDEPVARRLHARAGDRNIALHLSANLQQLREVLRDSDVVIASRLHSGIVSLAVNTPCVGFSATPKVGVFLQSLGWSERDFGLQAPAEAVVATAKRISREPLELPSAELAAMRSARENVRQMLRQPQARSALQRSVSA